MSALALRQLRAGRDFARDDAVAARMANYVYAICDEATRTCLLVDPAWNPGELVTDLADDGWSLSGVLLTHYHFDHAGGLVSGWPVAGVAELLALADVPVHIQAPELEWVRRGTGLEAAAFTTHESGDTIALGAHELTLLHTPGHTPGSQCVLVDGALLTGDTLFLDGCGRTDLPGGDAHALHDTLSRRLAPIAGGTIVYPGHDYAPRPHATMAELRAANPVLAPLGEAEWVARFS